MRGGTADVRRGWISGFLVLGLVLGSAPVAPAQDVEPDPGPGPTIDAYFRTLSGPPGEPRDEARLREMHERLLQAHRDGDTEAWMELEARDFTSVNGGRVTLPAFEDRRRGREAYLESATFTAYRDLREPRVTISEDGTLGWLVAEVEVRGSRPGPEGREVSFHDIWAWVELYRKTAEGWKMVGNASNRRPGGGADNAPAGAVQQSPDTVPTAEEIMERGRRYVASPERLQEVRTLDALAACRGPTGSFTTGVLSHRNGDLVFRQSYEDAPGFLAGIRRGRAWQVGDSSEIQTLNEANAAFLRGHEFLMIPVAAETRLTRPRAQGVTVFAGTVARTVELRDVAGLPFRIHYAVDDGRPLGYTQTNPRGQGPSRVTVELADWHEVEELRLPGRLTIFHGDDTWHYDFTRVRINSLTSKDFNPESLTTGGP